MLKNRYLEANIVEDLKGRMVFIGGPRQVGKTTLSKTLGSHCFKQTAYYNWDNAHDRKAMRNSVWPAESDLLIFDEIHKYKVWKNWIKGEYDKFKDRYRFLVTGSAKLNIFRKKGDSLFGRYHYYRLHPFSYNELYSQGKYAFNIETMPMKELQFHKEVNPQLVDNLLQYSGFPEPLIKQNQRFLRRWHRERIDLLIRDDAKDIGNVHDIHNVLLLAQLLPDKVGSLLSINTIREDLEVSFKAVKNWLSILESIYYCYRIYPYHKKSIRSIKKEPKLYLWDWSEVSNEGARFENMVAGHLLKLVHFLQDDQGYDAELHFLRNVDKKEVDFLVTIDKMPWFMCEVKLNETHVASSTYYFKTHLDIPFSYQIVRQEGVDFYKNNVRVLSASKFFSGII